jgi:nicotinate phosphoribosyltransferase
MKIESSALLTDLYQLTMLQGYFTRRMEQTAVFEFFVRTLPQDRNFLLVAGVEQLVEFLENFHFTADELKWLSTTDRFSAEFLEFLAGLRFTGDVDAAGEGTVIFAQEPIVRVTAPLPEAQVIESRLINLVHFQTSVASKAARCVLAVPSKALVDFGMRRAHGAEAACLATRASYLAGFAATSNVLAGRMFDIPISGTMAHSFVQTHTDERDAFEHFARANPGQVVLLLDTYDTEAAAQKVVSLASAWKQDGLRIEAVRLDSGDLERHAFQVRQILDKGGLNDVRIFASGHLDEYELQRLAKVNAPIDGFGVGTRLDTSADVPYLDCAYKIQEYAGRACRKRSEGKATWPGRKQVYRIRDREGRLTRDIVALENDSVEGEPLLQPLMRRGRRIAAATPTLTELRQRVRTELSSLPEPLRRLESGAQHPVEIARSVRALADAVDEELR